MAQMNFEKYRTLAERYTKALMQLAQEKNNLEKIADDIKVVASTFSENPDIEGFFVSPIISKEDKKEILEKSFKGKVDEDVYNFLNILVDKNRMFILPAVMNILQEKLLNVANILEIEVRTVIEIDEGMSKSLTEKMEKISGKKVVLKNIIDKDIIGGVVLSFDGKVIDGSVKAKLASLQKQLI